MRGLSCRLTVGSRGPGMCSTVRINEPAPGGIDAFLRHTPRRSLRERLVQQQLQLRPPAPPPPPCPAPRAPHATATPNHRPPDPGGPRDPVRKRGRGASRPDADAPPPLYLSSRPRRRRRRSSSARRPSSRSASCCAASGRTRARTAAGSPLGLALAALIPAIETVEIYLFKLVVDDVLVPRELAAAAAARARLRRPRADHGDHLVRRRATSPHGSASASCSTCARACSRTCRGSPRTRSTSAGSATCCSG